MKERILEMNYFLTVVASIIYNVASLGGGLCSFGAKYKPPNPNSLKHYDI